MKDLPILLVQAWAAVLSNFMITVTLILTGPRIRLFRTIMKISSRLPSKSYQKLSRLIHAKDIIGFHLIGYLLIFIAVKQSNVNNLYIHLVIFQMDMLYMNCVCVLKECFKELNDNLANMREFIAINNKLHVPRLIYYEQKTPFLIMEIKALKKQHLTISDTVQMLNSIFSFQLLATIVITISILTVCLYFYIIMWQHSLSTTPINGFFHVYFLSHIAHYFIKIVLIVWACETGKNQAQQVGTSIHDAFNSTTNEQIKDELQLFSLQILHCNNTFSAKCLTVDAKLLAGIMGSIITYLIIMFQFISDSCKGKTASNIAEIL
ncbi:PREDICTED: uncharacterized protein LOC105460613 [Wasmannia auropunctata]|uniref:uncharacterized protein LOC105460613 n=1 Tax=Wasmannia auropunctata TaxID=64793 RepID=UPI0005EFAA19|nr:PREDICTED: uncharacterized protein LOC105460613 [Wasmannia auropunctata]